MKNKTPYGRVAMCKGCLHCDSITWTCKKGTPEWDADGCTAKTIPQHVWVQHLALLLGLDPKQVEAGSRVEADNVLHLMTQSFQKLDKQCLRDILDWDDELEKALGAMRAQHHRGSHQKVENSPKDVRRLGFPAYYSEIIENPEWDPSDELDDVFLENAETERRRAKAWMSTAAQHARNESYWRERALHAEDELIELSERLG